MRYAAVTKETSEGCEAFVADFPDCESTGESLEDALIALRGVLHRHFDELFQSGEEIEAPSSWTEFIEAALLSSDGSKTATYLVVIGRAPNNYAAWVPDLPVCVSVGDTLTEMRAMIKEAIEFHIEFLEECGDPVPLPESTGTFINAALPSAEPVAD